MAIDRLRIELTATRLEYERCTKICENPYARDEDFRARNIAWGQWSGMAKAVEALLNLEKCWTATDGDVY